MTKPTPTLEQTILALAARGEISDLGLSRNSSNTKWRAHFTPTSVFGASFAEDEDPIKALILAMGNIKLKSKPTTVEVIPQSLVEIEKTIAADMITVDVAKMAGAERVDPDIDALM